jgi:predicted acylesterase/phospholipase RssA
MLKGRKLFVVTTNLDTQRTVVWDMGKIAALGTPEALKLFRDVMAASASIPLVFLPILIEAEGEGHVFRRCMSTDACRRRRDGAGADGLMVRPIRPDSR